MLTEDRRDKIVDMVRKAGSATVPELADALGTSPSTIRRDLVELDASHRLLKVHGGATTLERAHVTRDLTIPERRDLHTGEKDVIARYAASLIQPEGFVYIDSGSTTLRLIACLPETPSVTYVTNSVGHARRLMARGLRTVVLGGELKPQTEALVGPDALATLDRYWFSCGFWGANGVSLEAGLTTPGIEEAQVKRISIRHAAHPYVLCDASKFGMVAPVKFSELDDVTILTTGAVPEAYAKLGAIVKIAEDVL